MKKILVALASLAIALAANFGIASAHPFRDPTPSSEPTLRVDQNTTAPSANDEVEQEGDQQTGDMNDAVQGVENKEQTGADEDTDTEDTDVVDETESDEDANDDDAAAKVATPAGTTPVITTGKGEQDRHGNAGQSTKSGHDDDD